LIYIANEDIEIPSDFIDKAVSIIAKLDIAILFSTGINIKANLIGDSP